MCDKAVDGCLAALNFILDWFVAGKMMKIYFTDLYADETILYFIEDSSNVPFICNGMGILNTGLNNIDLDTNFEEDDPDAIIIIRLLAWDIKSEKRKPFKKKLNEKLMPAAWHPKRWWDFSVSENEGKK